jgi:hypothetical protein
MVPGRLQSLSSDAGERRTWLVHRDTARSRERSSRL